MRLKLFMQSYAVKRRSGYTVSSALLASWLVHLWWPFADDQGWD